MAYVNDYDVEKILSIVEEAKIRNYPEHVLRYDLDNYVSEILHRYDHYEYTQQDIDNANDESYDEGKEDGYSEGYDDGEKSGKAEGFHNCLERLASFIQYFKLEYGDNEQFNSKEIRTKLIELLCELDEDAEINIEELE